MEGRNRDLPEGLTLASLQEGPTLTGALFSSAEIIRALLISPCMRVPFQILARDRGPPYLPGPIASVATTCLTSLMKGSQWTR